MAGTGYPPDKVQRHDIGQQKKARNKILNPAPLTQKERREKKEHERGKHRGESNWSYDCRICRDHR